MAIPTIQQLEDATRDLDDLESIVNGVTTVTTRTGGEKLSVSQALNQIFTAQLDTTTELIAAADYTLLPTNALVSTGGFTASGDGGAAIWKKTGNTITASQTPVQLADAKCSDSAGNEFELVFDNIINILSIGGDTAADNRDVVLAFNASSATALDLTGKDFDSTINCDFERELLQKNYFNGNLSCLNSALNTSFIRKTVIQSDDELQVLRKKSPILTWRGKKVLWLGTSIPHQGVGVDGYPELFGKILSCTTSNLAWSGSKACYSYADDEFTLSTVQSLSMTEDDRIAGLAEFGGSSVYDDSFDLITKSSQMTADYRIKRIFQEQGSQDVVFLDHNHNDRRKVETYTAVSPTITGITKGATTDITLSSIAGIAVGDAVYLRVTGIGNLEYAAARVQTVVSNTITLNIDSSGYSGTFSSGTCHRVDRNTIYGAWDFLIAYIKNMSIIYGDGNVTIILSSAPSYYTNDDEPDFPIWSVGQAIRRVGIRWGLAFFDIAKLYEVQKDQHLIYFPDTVHPSTLETRQALVRYWVEWAIGGRSGVTNPDDYVARGAGAEIDWYPALYSPYDQGYSTRKFIYDESINLINDDFSAGIGSWATGGTAGYIVPTVVAAPWDAGAFAVRFQSVAAAKIVRIQKTPTLGDNPNVSFDFYLPSTDITATSGTQATLCELGNTLACYQVSITASSNGTVKLRILRFTDPGTGPTITMSVGTITLQAATKYNADMRIIKGDGVSEPGYFQFYLDSVLLFADSIDNDTLTGMNIIRLGVTFTNVTKDFDVYMSNIVVDSKAGRSSTSAIMQEFVSSSSAPSPLVVGIAVDDGTNWSTVNATGNPRPVFYDGTSWVAMF